METLKRMKEEASRKRLYEEMELLKSALSPDTIYWITYKICQTLSTSNIDIDEEDQSLRTIDMDIPIKIKSIDFKLLNDIYNWSKYGMSVLLQLLVESEITTQIPWVDINTIVVEPKSFSDLTYLFGNIDCCALIHFVPFLWPCAIYEDVRYWRLKSATNKQLKITVTFRRKMTTPPPVVGIPVGSSIEHPIDR